MGTTPESQDPVILPPLPVPDEEGLAPPPDETNLPSIDVADEPPPPLGRSWAFDFGNETFVRGGQGPSETRGVATLLGWIDKCLHTARGALAIHPPGYGVVEPDAIFGRPIGEVSAEDLETRFREALTFHPRIVDVVNMQIAVSDDDDAAYATFDVLTDPPTEDAELVSVRVDLEAA